MTPDPMMSALAAPACSAFEERVVAFSCAGARLRGILTTSVQAASPDAVLIAVGGPQYRAGSHRQFVLLARRLAAAGFPTLRFDYRGMGDSEGEPRAFDAIEDDLRAAIDALCREAGVRRLTVFGLCDAASSALMYATSDARVQGLVLLNPWVRSAATLATTHIRHYYGARLAERAFWHKLLSGKLDWRGSLRSLLRDAAEARKKANADETGFQAQMAAGLKRFAGRVLLILSGNDMTAREFLDHARASHAWQGLLASPRVERFDVPQADHTFSSAVWRSAVEDKMLAWLRSREESAK